MHFHVLGLGSIGTLLAHHLRRAVPSEHPITLIHKLRVHAEQTLASGNIIRVERNGVIIPSTGYKVDAFDSPFPDSRESPHLKSPNPELASSRNYQAPIESLFVTTKAHQALPAISKLVPRLSANSTVVLLQNGMGLYEELANRVFRNPEHRPHFILASNTHGVYTKGFHHVVHTGTGQVEFSIAPSPSRNFEASLEDESVPRHERHLQLNDITTAQDPHFARYRSLRDTVAVLLLLEPLHTVWRPMHEMQIILRRKLVVNAVINPLTAIMGCRNGDLFSSPAAHRIMRSVCYEAARAFAAEFQAETNQWIYGLRGQGVDVEDINVTRIPPQLTKTALEEEVVKIASATRGNLSSMLSDIRHGKATEIDYINGYLLEIGKTHNVRMPTNETLVNLVKMRNHIPLDQQL
ncbi:putative 2-dehydropantoate 2-reductase [Leucoagaricus sp. SymC.cos]|nr:putative 2-dehydropantoate 2-reductase [Leucoagaricus sp. SymC.cos]